MKRRRRPAQTQAEHERNGAHSSPGPALPADTGSENLSVAPDSNAKGAEDVEASPAPIDSGMLGRDGYHPAASPGPEPFTGEPESVMNVSSAGAARKSSPIVVRPEQQPAEPYAAIPHRAIFDERLTDTDIRVLGAILFYARSRPDCIHSVEAIRKRAHKKSDRTVQASLKRLEAAGYIALETDWRLDTNRRIVLLWRRQESPVAPQKIAGSDDGTIHLAPQKIAGSRRTRLVETREREKSGEGAKSEFLPQRGTRDEVHPRAHAPTPLKPPDPMPEPEADPERLEKLREMVRAAEANRPDGASAKYFRELLAKAEASAMPKVEPPRTPYDPSTPLPEPKAGGNPLVVKLLSAMRPGALKEARERAVAVLTQAFEPTDAALMATWYRVAVEEAVYFDEGEGLTYAYQRAMGPNLRNRGACFHASLKNWRAHRRWQRDNPTPGLASPGPAAELASATA